jgi:DNA ligase-1
MNEKGMTLLSDWDGRKLDAWYATEKYDGCRGYWDGYTMWTRNGNIVKLPEAFRAALPAIALDGEIWAGRGQFTEARLATQYGHFTPNIRYAVYDAPDIENDWRNRMRYVESIHAPNDVRFPAPVTDIAVTAFAVQLAELTKSQGGEGIVVRSRNLDLYKRGRSLHAMRIK